MSTLTTTPYRSPGSGSGPRTGGDSFVHLLRAEWTKFRTVRGWVVGTVAAAVVMVLVGLLSASGSHRSCSGPGGSKCPSAPIGPGGQAVNDAFSFVHQPLGRDGSLTVRVTSLTGLFPELTAGGGSPAAGNGNGNGPEPTRSGSQPWAKAGLIVKASTRQGSAYAAIMVTPGHGVRLQSNFTRDTAGLPGTVSADSPRWLRLTRSGDVITGYDSVDGTRWVKVGSARLTGLPTTAQAGLFVASPEYEVTSQHVGGGSTTGGSTVATAVFDRLDARGLPPGGRWTYDRVGDTPGPGGPLAQDVPAASSFQESGGRFTVSGSGNIAPAVSDGGNAVEHTLAGAFAGLIVVIVLGTLFVTAEYRRGLIRTTLAASPRRGRVLAAKALVIAAVTFTAGLVAAVVALAVGKNILRSNGIELYPVTTLTQLRLVAGTAALLAVTAVLALAVGTVLRRSAGAVTGVIVLVVLPYILAVASVLPTGSARWLLRLTPAAAFAVQQSLRQYPQVDHLYAPLQGYFPLSPWAGFAVLCAYAALALGIAVVLLRRRDA